ncbi:MAG: hypothetical protein ACO3CT_07810 [Vulcanococcus sp.]
MDLGTQERRPLNRRDAWVLLGLWLGSALLDGLWIQQHQAPPAWDQGDHLSRALGIWEVLTGAAPWSAQWWHALWAQAPSYRGPLTYVLTAPLFTLLGPGFASAMASGTVFNGLLLASTYGLGRQLFSRNAGLWAAAFCAMAPALLNQRTDYLIDLSLTAVLSGAWWLLSQWRWNPRLGWAIAAGAGLGAVVLTRPTGLVLLWAPLLLLFVRGCQAARQGRWGLIRQGLLAAVVAWALAWPWFSQNWLTILSTINKARQWGVAYQDGLEANTLEGWLYYPRLIPTMVGSTLTALVLAGALVAAIQQGQLFRLPSRPRGWWLWWLSFPVGGLLVCTLMSSKDFRFVLPLLPQVALLLGILVAQVQQRWGPLWKGSLIGVGLLGALWNQFGWGLDLSGFPPHRPLKEPGWPLEQIIGTIRQSSPNQLSTLAVLPDSERLNAFNLEAEGRRQNFRVAARQTVAPLERSEEELSNFDWFLLKGGDQGVMSDERQARQSALVRQSGAFSQAGSWALPDGSTAVLMRRTPLSVQATEIACTPKPAATLTAIPGGLQVELRGSAKQLRGAQLLLDLRNGKSSLQADQAVGQGLLRSSSSGCLQLVQRLALPTVEDAQSGLWQARLQLLQANGALQPIPLSSATLELLPASGDDGALASNRVALLRELGQQLRRGELDSLFSKVGQLNQSDPEQVYLANAETILRARLRQQPHNLDDLYGLALAQALQRHASDAALTLQELHRLDAGNPNALLGLGVVELYRFRPAEAQRALDQAAKMSPGNSTLRTLRIVASALRLDLPQTLSLLRS